MNKVIAALVTIIVGYFATALGMELLNWPQLGPIAAVITMGIFLWNAIESKDGEQDKSAEEDN